MGCRKKIEICEFFSCFLASATQCAPANFSGVQYRGEHIYIFRKPLKLCTKHPWVYGVVLNKKNHNWGNTVHPRTVDMGCFSHISLAPKIGECWFWPLVPVFGAYLWPPMCFGACENCSETSRPRRFWGMTSVFVDSRPKLGT